MPRADWKYQIDKKTYHLLLFFMFCLLQTLALPTLYLLSSFFSMPFEDYAFCGRSRYPPTRATQSTPITTGPFLNGRSLDPHQAALTRPVWPVGAAGLQGMPLRAACSVLGIWRSTFLLQHNSFCIRTITLALYWQKQFKLKIMKSNFRLDEFARKCYLKKH